jgi:hypothetical protein
MPSVLPRSSSPAAISCPTCLACMVALARGMERAIEIMRPRVSSATATALAPGVFMTTMPRRGGIGVDVVHAYTGAADDAEFGADSSKLASAWTAERTTRASASASSAARPFLIWSG